jgi:DNA-binding transcriptional LysR family regulator
MFVVADEAIDAVVITTDELASRATIPLTALRDRALIALPVGTGIRQQLEQACAAAGFTPIISFEANTPLALVELAEHGLGIAVVPRPYWQGRDKLHPLMITPKLHARLVLAWRSTSPISPATRAFVEKARSRLAPERWRTRRP